MSTAGEKRDLNLVRFFPRQFALSHLLYLRSNAPQEAVKATLLVGMHFTNPLKQMLRINNVRSNMMTSQATSLITTKDMESKWKLNEYKDRGLER
jgi:hypothetical protein